MTITTETTKTERVKNRLRYALNAVQAVGIGAFTISILLWLLGVPKPFGAGLLLSAAALIVVAVVTTWAMSWKALAADKLEEFEFWFISAFATLLGGIMLAAIVSAFYAGW